MLVHVGGMVMSPWIGLTVRPLERIWSARWNGPSRARNVLFNTPAEESELWKTTCILCGENSVSGARLVLPSRFFTCMTGISLAAIWIYRKKEKKMRWYVRTFTFTLPGRVCSRARLLSLDLSMLRARLQEISLDTTLLCWSRITNRSSLLFCLFVSQLIVITADE